jgi:hypothetical protein
LFTPFPPGRAANQEQGSANQVLIIHTNYSVPRATKLSSQHVNNRHFISFCGMFVPDSIQFFLLTAAPLRIFCTVKPKFLACRMTQGLGLGQQWPIDLAERPLPDRWPMLNSRLHLPQSQATCGCVAAVTLASFGTSA